jgi:hypothetical protein
VDLFRDTKGALFRPENFLEFGSPFLLRAATPIDTIELQQIERYKANWDFEQEFLADRFSTYSPLQIRERQGLVLFPPEDLSIQYAVVG